jgi:hypothetical protein
VVFGPKRHGEFVGGRLVEHQSETARDLEFVDATEAQLGGTYADPPSMRGRVAVPDGYRRWSMAAVRREVDFVLARAGDPSVLRSSEPAPWDQSESSPFPAFRRLMVKTPEMADALPACLGARPGTRYIEGEVRSLSAGETPAAALDPGGDLAGWRDLVWVNKGSGRAECLSTAPEDFDTVQPVTLDDKGMDWSRPPSLEPITAVEVDRVRNVGHVSGVLDADEAGMVGDLGRYRPDYERCACGCGKSVIRGHGERYVDDEHRRQAAAHRRRKPETTRFCECGCGTPLPPGRRDKRFVSNTHRVRAARVTRNTATKGDRK